MTFEAFSDVSDQRAQALKVLEEASELREAASGLVKGEGSRERMLDEWADVMQAMANFEASFGITDAERGDARIRCYRRNRERGRC